MCKLLKPNKRGTAILVVIAVFAAVKIIACGIVGWGFYRHATAPKVPPTAVEVSQTLVPRETSTPVSPTLALTESTEAEEVSPALTLTLTLVPTMVETPAVVEQTLEPTATPALTTTTYVPAPGEKWILVDLSEQKLYAYEGTTLFLESLCSTGTQYHPTVEGQYRIYIKLLAARMTGPGYDLSNVPFVMYFYRGYGLHGTYWHDNFGHPMSHGCINLPTPVAEKLFWWADPVLPEGANTVWASEDNPGTLVIIQP